MRVESRSGYSFDPAHAFEEFDLSSLQPVSREQIVRQAEEAVKTRKLGNVGLIAAPPLAGQSPAPLPRLSDVKQGFDAMKNAARAEIRKAGLDPDHLPDYKTVNQTFKQKGKKGEEIPKQVLEQFPEQPFEVAKLNARAAAACGLPQAPVMLGRGNRNGGIEHLWRHHKELFTNPALAIRLLEDTLGNENCRVVVSLKRAIQRDRSAGRTIKQAICLKKIVLHNPLTQTYCVMVWDGQELKLVSWNDAGDDYGDLEWTLQ